MIHRLIRLAAGSSSAAISALGAEPQSWNVAGHELLWSGDPAFWPQVSPILFPVVGWTRNGEMRIKGKTYPLGLHGFAARQEFEVLGQAADRASFRLRHNEETRALYPFEFELLVEYRLAETSLEAAFTVRNPGIEPLPYALGLHPGFAWPFAGGRAEAHRIVFAGEVSPLVPVIAPGGLISARRREVPLEDGRTLRLAGDLFAREALLLPRCGRDAASLRERRADKRSRSRTRHFRISPCGRSPALPISASSPGPAMAIRKVSRGISSRSRRCGSCRPAQASGTACAMPG